MDQYAYLKNRSSTQALLFLVEKIKKALINGEKAAAVFLANVNSRSRSLYAIARPSVVCL